MTTQFVTWQGITCEVKYHSYRNGRTAIALVEVETGEAVTTASVNLTNQDCSPNHAWIKDYGQNNGIEKVLYQAGVIGPPIRTARLQWTEVNLCRILSPPDGI